MAGLLSIERRDQVALVTPQRPEKRNALSIDLRVELSEAFGRLGEDDGVGSCPRPVVAAVNGPALAGGFALALLCDLRVAAANASFGFPELPRGIPPSYASARAAMGPGLAAEITLTGRVFD